MYQILLFFFFLLPTLVSAQKMGKPFVQAYPAKVYGSAVQNWGIGQDKRGIMYFANDQGVLEYDGRDWRLFVLPHYAPVRSIRVSEENTVYVGGVGELGYLSPNAVGSLEFVSLKNLLPDSVRFEDVWSIQTTPEMVYFQTDSYIFGYEPQTQKPLKIWSLPTPESDFFLTFLVHKKLFVHSRKSGLFVMEKGKLLLSNAGASFAGKRIYTMLPFSPTKIVIGTREDGLFLLEYSPTGKISIEKWDCEANAFLLKNQLYSGNSLPQNRMVLCTRRAGAVVIDHYGKIVEVFDKNAGLTDENVRSAFLSNDNILWFALNNGINHVSYYSPIRLWDDTRGIEGTIHDIHEFAGQTYLATDLGLFVLNKITDKFEPLQGVSNIEAWTFEIFKTSYGTEKLLAGTNDGVVEIQNNTAFSILSSKKAIRSLKQSIHFPECVYVGQKSGLLRLRYAQNDWVLDANFEQVNQEVISLFETPSMPQELWIGTFTDGIYKVLVGKDTPKTRPKPYRLSKGLPAMRDSRLYPWKGEMLVACTEGLFVYDTQKDKFAISPMWAKRFPHEKRGVYSLTTDNQQNLWLADHDTRKHSIGAFRIQKNNDYEWQEGIMKRLPEFSESKLYVDNQKTIWVGGTDGLYRYYPQEVRAVPSPLHALIREVRTQNDSIIFGGVFFEKLEGNKKRITLKQSLSDIPKFRYDAMFEISFHCAAPFYDVEKRTEFSYLLEGYETPIWGSKHKDYQWSSWTRESKRIYNNLPEGMYAFHVKARNVYGEESIVASYRFRVLAPWYRTLGAYLMYVVLALVIVYFVTFVYTHNLRMQKVRLEQIVTERTRELVESGKKLELTHQLLVRHNTDLNDSIDYASRIQRVMLPKLENIKNAFPDSFVFWQPLQKVSGDFYWFTETSMEPRYAKDPNIGKGKVSIFKGIMEGKKIIAAIDCTGHGIPGAFMSMLGDAYLDQIVITEGITQPQLILQELDALIRYALKQDEGTNADGMDMAICVVNPNQNLMEFAGAKNGLICVQAGEASIIRGDRFGIGGAHYGDDEKIFTRHIIPIDQPTAFYLYSDGLPDQFGGEKAKKFSTKQMQAFFATHFEKSMQEQFDILNQTVNDWIGSYEQIDDILVIGVKLQP